MSSSSESDSNSRLTGHNGDYVPEENAQDPDDDDPENYDSDLDLSKDVRPISAYIDDREELFNQVIKTLEPEGRLDALVPEILSVLSRIELDQLCIDQLRMLSAKKLRKIMEGIDINEISSDEEDDTLKVVQEPMSKWKPVQEESANAEDKQDVENGDSRSRSSSRSSSRSRSSSASSSSGDSRRRRRHHRSRRDRHRRHRHGRRRHRRSRESSRRHRRHRRKSESVSSEEEDERQQQIERPHIDETSNKSGSLSASAHFPVLYDVGTNMMIPMMPTAVSCGTATTMPTSLASFVSSAPGFVDPALAVAGVAPSAIGMPTMTTTVGGMLISSTGFATKKSQYDVTIEDEFEDDTFSPPSSNGDRYNGRNKHNGLKQTHKSTGSSVALSRQNVPVRENVTKKNDSSILPHADQRRDSTPPPPGTDGVLFENNFGDNEPEPPGTAEILF